MTRGVALIIEDYDGRFLLHLRDEKAPLMANEWCLVGGGVEENESYEETGRRELLEETGLSTIHLKSYICFLRHDTERQMHIFRVQVDTRNEKVVLGEGKELRFFSRDEALKLLASIQNKNQFLQIFEEFLKSKV